MPDIVLSTGSYFPDTELGFRKAAECGYDGVELMVNHDRRSQSPESVAALADTYGVAVRSVHAPCLMGTQLVWGRNPEVKLRRTVDMARALGAGVVVVHPPWRWQRGYAETFGELVAELDEPDDPGGVRVTVENMFAVEAFGRRVETFTWSEDPALAAFAALTLDTSHAGAARQDLLALYAAMGGRVRHLHLSDSTSSRGDEHLPPGAGTLPLADLADAMVADGYDGAIVLEVAIRRLPEGTRTVTTTQCQEWARVAFGP
jgi:sugar phosphate isomerase/epimerase